MQMSFLLCLLAHQLFEGFANHVLNGQIRGVNRSKHALCLSACVTQYQQGIQRFGAYAAVAGGGGGLRYRRCRIAKVGLLEQLVLELKDNARRCLRADAVGLGNGLFVVGTNGNGKLSGVSSDRMEMAALGPTPDTVCSILKVDSSLSLPKPNSSMPSSRTDRWV